MVQISTGNVGICRLAPRNSYSKIVRLVSTSAVKGVEKTTSALSKTASHRFSMPCEPEVGKFAVIFVDLQKSAPKKT